MGCAVCCAICALCAVEEKSPPVPVRCELVWAGDVSLLVSARPAPSPAPCSLYRYCPPPCPTADPCTGIRSGGGSQQSGLMLLVLQLARCR